MGCFTYSTLEKRARRHSPRIRVVMYSGDVGTDLITLYLLYTDPPPRVVFAWQLTLLFILLPILVTAIAVIADVVTSTERSIRDKILLVTVIICGGALFIPFYFIIMDALDSCREAPSGRNAEDSEKARLNEALMQNLPQATLQSLIIMVMVNRHDIDPDEYPGVHPLQWVSLTFSVVNFIFTIASSTYLFQAKFTTRLVFFACGLVAVPSRLVAAGLYLISPATLLALAIIVWAVKSIFWRCCHGCCCACCRSCFTPAMSDSHHQCNMAVMHVPITWLVTTYMNVFTPTGLLISVLNMFWAVQFAIAKDNPGSMLPMYLLSGAVLSSFSLIINLVMVAVPKYRQTVGEQWLNTNPETGRSQLY